ncbi:MAG: hypothetical protein ABI557_13445, partial [Aureliella sp.]
MPRRSMTVECPTNICAPTLWLVVGLVLAAAGCQPADEASAPQPSAPATISGPLLNVEAIPWPVVARV